VNELLRNALRLPFLDWDDAQAYYDRLRIADWSDEASGDTREKAYSTMSRRVFNVIVPELRPNRDR